MSRTLPIHYIDHFKSIVRKIKNELSMFFPLYTNVIYIHN
jgi:hypothetical protein